MFKYLIYGILLILAIGGGLMVNLSYDFAIQIQQYNFGNEINNAKVAWRKDALLSCGIGFIVTVVVIICYNLVEKIRDEKDMIKRRSIISEQLLRHYHSYLLFPFYTMTNLNNLDNLKEFNAEELRCYFDNNFYQDVRRINLIDKSYLEKYKNWEEYILESFDDLNKGVDKLLLAYHTCLDYDTIKKINQTRHPNFIMKLDIKKHFPLLQQRITFYMDNEMIADLEIHINECLDMMGKLEKLLK